MKTVFQILSDKKNHLSYQDKEYLLRHILKKTKTELYSQIDQKLNTYEFKKHQHLADLCHQGHPLPYILGESKFYGNSFKIQKGVFIPRPETEVLVENVIHFYKKNPPSQKIKLMDFGCGSGNIGLSLILNIPHSHLFCVDSNPKALNLARKNANILGLEDRVTFILEDVTRLSPCDFKDLSLIVANPPYIARNDHEISKDVLNHEPHDALFSKEEGMADIRSWMDQAICFLSQSTISNRPQYFFEIGFNQKERVISLLKSHPFVLSFKVYSDFSNHPRVAHISIDNKK